MRFAKVTKVLLAMVLGSASVAYGSVNQPFEAEGSIVVEEGTSETGICSTITSVAKDVLEENNDEVGEVACTLTTQDCDCANIPFMDDAPILCACYTFVVTGDASNPTLVETQIEASIQDGSFQERCRNEGLQGCKCREQPCTPLFPFTTVTGHVAVDSGGDFDFFAFADLATDTATDIATDDGKYYFSVSTSVQMYNRQDVFGAGCECDQINFPVSTPQCYCYALVMSGSSQDASQTNTLLTNAFAEGGPFEDEIRKTYPDVVARQGPFPPFGAVNPTDAPVAAPTDAPISPTDAPVPALTDAPISPTDAPVPAPTDAPVPAPTDAPVPAPTDSSISPTDAPVAAPTDVSISPTDAPVAAPVAAPTDAPTVTRICEDAPNSARFDFVNNKSQTRKSCIFIESLLVDATKNFKNKICNLDANPPQRGNGITETTKIRFVCPRTCEICPDQCKDSNRKFILDGTQRKCSFLDKRRPAVQKRHCNTNVGLTGGNPRRPKLKALCQARCASVGVGRCVIPSDEVDV